MKLFQNFLICFLLSLFLINCGAQNLASTANSAGSAGNETHEVTIIENADGSFTITSNGIPDHDYGPFPNENNPNSVLAQNHQVTTEIPNYSGAEISTQLGFIGFFLNGVPIYNWSTAEGTDAVINEIFDQCDGHPDPRGSYHYHQESFCLDDFAHNESHVGISIDGFKIYGTRHIDGSTTHNPALDNCNGHDHDAFGFHYHITTDFPYTLYCFQGDNPY